MDLGSLLNREDGQRTTSRIQSQPLSQASPATAPYTSHSEPPRADLSPPPPPPGYPRERPSQPAPLYTNDPRSPPASNFTQAQSPYQHASGPPPSLSGGPPGYPFPGPPHGTPVQQHPVQNPPTNPYNHAGYAPSPSPHIPQPSTPGPHSGYPPQHRPQSSHSATSSSPSFVAHPPRESPSAPTGPPPQSQQGRHFSPYVQQIPQPGTPLGPPPSFQRPSPNAQRHPSEYDHSRTYSTGSMGGAPQSISQNHNHTPGRRDSTGRQLSYDKERERSQSVSPKTVVRPAPGQLRVSESPQMDRSIPRAPSHDRAINEYTSEIVHPGRLTEKLETPTPPPMAQVTHQRTYSSSHSSSAYQSPVAHANKIQTPRAVHASLPQQNSTQSLKRDASAISGSSASPKIHARKRLRADEIPTFARSARSSKPKKMDGHRLSAPPPQAIRESISVDRELNGQVAPNAGIVQPAPSPADIPWEPCLTNMVPFEDLTRLMCDRIFFHIGMVDPPQGGAKFEIEAKLGEIQSADDHSRIRIPVLSECLVDKDSVLFPKTRFDSSMNEGQHKLLNDYLNECLIKAQHSGREAIHWKHTRENDNFYELTPVGRDALPEHITRYLKKTMHKPRVRITTDRATGMVVAKIIKIRLADFDVYNPRCLFDYRISVNLESPWSGPEAEHLLMVNEAEGRRGERQKDRMSYRHFACQIDLTQVTYPMTDKREHELEVEVSPDTLRTEIQLAREGKPNRYEALVRAFVDNVRVLSRRFQR